MNKFAIIVIVIFVVGVVAIAMRPQLAPLIFLAPGVP